MVELRRYALPCHRHFAKRCLAIVPSCMPCDRPSFLSIDYNACAPTSCRTNTLHSLRLFDGQTFTSTYATTPYSGRAACLWSSLSVATASATTEERHNAGCTPKAFGASYGRVRASDKDTASSSSSTPLQAYYWRLLRRLCCAERPWSAEAIPGCSVPGVLISPPSIPMLMSVCAISGLTPVKIVSAPKRRSALAVCSKTFTTWISATGNPVTSRITTVA